MARIIRLPSLHSVPIRAFVGGERYMGGGFNLGSAEGSGLGGFMEVKDKSAFDIISLDPALIAGMLWRADTWRLAFSGSASIKVNHSDPDKLPGEEVEADYYSYGDHSITVGASAIDIGHSCNFYAGNLGASYGPAGGWPQAWSDSYAYTGLWDHPGGVYTFSRTAGETVSSTRTGTRQPDLDMRLVGLYEDLDTNGTLEFTPRSGISVQASGSDESTLDNWEDLYPQWPDTYPVAGTSCSAAAFLSGPLSRQGGVHAAGGAWYPLLDLTASMSCACSAKFNVEPTYFPAADYDPVAPGWFGFMGYDVTLTGTLTYQTPSEFYAVETGTFNLYYGGSLVATAPLYVLYDTRQVSALSMSLSLYGEP